MTFANKGPTNWLVGGVALLVLLVLGRPLLVPLVFTFLIWVVLNALADVLLGFKLPRWLAWIGAFVLLLGGIFLVMSIVAGEAAQFAVQAPTYVATLEKEVTDHLAPLGLGTDIGDIFTRADIAGVLAGVAGSLGSSALVLVEILVFVGFLLAEQNVLSTKFARLHSDPERMHQNQLLLRRIAGQLQTYLGVYTILSVVMGLISFGLLIAMGVEFAAFWALIIFILTYIPTIGAIAVVVPALMALVQFGTIGPPLIIIVVLGAVHFVLMNVVITLVLGQSLNLSPFAIIVSLTFWGLIWGVSGLFLAVPVTAAIAIVCGHIDELRWISTLLAAAPSGHGKAPASTASH